MIWIIASQQLPKPFERVWVKTSAGDETTGYVNSSGVWVINCPRIAAQKPAVTSWRK
ncbi:50S ribosomal protein L13 [Chimaeribacter californicus]|uniref:50S ribosomal protein L13 n=1 Tax=Chimaeribacter californicus TaxID=2060067 RepID=A0A2N5EDU7_9GAMM|nr:50S ribosomal protein L13 [Chimaeribacter californicus]PLR40715.1 50S ribosomal protein L13 [Chimaeribacter californicus]